MPKVGKRIMGWDTCDIGEGELKYRMENWQDFYDEKPGEDKLREQIYSDSCFFSMAWDDLKEYLTEVIRKKNPDGYWKAVVSNFGWRNQDGYKYFYTEQGEEFLRKLLPDTDCTFKIYNYGRGLAIQNWHHDSPVGNEWYYILPCAYSTYERMVA